MTPNGAAIRSIRKAQGRGLRWLAGRIDRSPGYLSKIEQERQSAGPETLRRIAAVLDVPVGAITKESSQ
ncbi:helix-turn-helix domain-containing protein [Streptomyces sp. NBC_01298]|uniref:helix-turn-helix domain-containing protein n=1 Tax=Streptomyces sp. NBC_01298 TaxID=2903817 RepID=UPI003FA38E54